MNDVASTRIALILIGTVVAFMGLVGRLYHLQVMKGDFYRVRSESNFIQERTIKHSRGKILDAHGRVLVDNRLSYDLFLTFSMLPDTRRSLKFISTVLDLTKSDLQMLDAEINQRASLGIFDKISVRELSNIDNCETAQKNIQENMIPGLDVTFLPNGCVIDIDPQTFPTRSIAFRTLRSLLPNSQDAFKEAWDSVEKKSQGLARFRPMLFLSDIGYDAYAKIENAISLGKLAGVSVTASKRRRYIEGEFATHLIGYVNQVSLDDIKKAPDTFKSGDSIGRYGIEATFEEYLRGQDGVERVVVDAKGRRFDDAWEFELLGKERFVDPIPGANVRLTIDYELQKAAEDLFLEKSGSVIVMDVHSGFVKALASFPSFDPNMIVSANNSKVFSTLLNDPQKPFGNKVIQGQYAPGSTFKPMTGIGGLRKGIITPTSPHYCSGNYRIHKTTWRCFKREGHGQITLNEAIKVSCDSYFYELGHRMGLDYLSEIAFKLGFGDKTGIDLLGEAKGIVPNPVYYKKRMGYVAPGFVVNMSIGQGDLTVTPIQLASAYAAIANGGTVYKPQIVSEIFDESGSVLKKFEREKIRSLADDALDFSEILEGLSHVTEQGGSAHGLRYRPDFADIREWMKAGDIQIVGKTGTAQVVKLSKTVDHVDPANVPYEHRDHAWFVSVYPKENPQIVVVVMSEHGGFGGSTSAPVAVRLLKKWEESRSLVAQVQEKNYE